MKGRHTALVADDDEMVRKIVAHQLKDLGIAEVTTAEDGAATRRLLHEKGPFDLVVFDLRMPGADGVELLHDVERLQPGSALILISGVGAKVLRASEALARERRLRLLGTLPKPVTTADLKLLVDRLDDVAPVRVATTSRGLPTAARLRAAITAGEITIEVQPQTDLRTGRLVAAEALARWKPAEFGNVGPDVFIPLAEENGLIEPLTDRVLRQALEANSRWRQRGLDLRIGVNLSSSSFEAHGLPEELESLARFYGVNPRKIVIEATETALIRNFSKTLTAMTRLRLRGFHLSIDDFGTGHSSFKRLKDIPFDELKVDRSFVEAATTDSEARSIVESTVHLARELKLKTVAEGVETREVELLMNEIGCDCAQGFYIARPMPADDLPVWAASH
jgi:EAL domain-containing protein (putative c-di-GMP-specific phosphodiesterase class I)/ActR/RegA family two-component response regulator